MSTAVKNSVMNSCVFLSTDFDMSEGEYVSEDDSIEEAVQNPIDSSSSRTEILDCEY